jgi:hypothetical protein
MPFRRFKDRWGRVPTPPRPLGAWGIWRQSWPDRSLEPNPMRSVMRPRFPLKPQQATDYTACCALAVAKPCSCAVSWSCPEHGEKHVGKHD